MAPQPLSITVPVAMAIFVHILLILSLTMPPKGREQNLRAAACKKAIRRPWNVFRNSASFVTPRTFSLIPSMCFSLRCQTTCVLGKKPLKIWPLTFWSLRVKRTKRKTERALKTKCLEMEMERLCCFRKSHLGWIALLVSSGQKEHEVQFRLKNMKQFLPDWGEWDTESLSDGPFDVSLSIIYEKKHWKNGHMIPGSSARTVFWWYITMGRRFLAQCEPAAVWRTRIIPRHMIHWRTKRGQKISFLFWGH